MRQVGVENQEFSGGQIQKYDGSQNAQKCHQREENHAALERATEGDGAMAQ
jgi:hypothetical protein